VTAFLTFFAFVTFPALAGFAFLDLLATLFAFAFLALAGFVFLFETFATFFNFLLDFFALPAITQTPSYGPRSLPARVLTRTLCYELVNSIQQLILRWQSQYDPHRCRSSTANNSVTFPKPMSRGEEPDAESQPNGSYMFGNARIFQRLMR